jgi:hypothetical protein
MVLKATARIILILLMSAILVGSCSDLIIEGTWILNQSSITAEKCENRDKPQLHCDGKCYLKKQLANEQEQKKPLNVDLNKISFHWVTQQDITPLAFLFSEPLIYLPYQLKPSSESVHPLDQPPQVS